MPTHGLLSGALIGVTHTKKKNNKQRSEFILVYTKFISDKMIKKNIWLRDKVAEGYCRF